MFAQILSRPHNIFLMGPLQNKNRNLTAFGFGVIEALVSMIIVGVLAYSMLTYFEKIQRSSVNLGESSSCENVVNSILTAIKSQDNNLIVRNWIPFDPLDPAQRAPPNNMDPFCTNTKGVCDTLPMLATGPTGSVDQLPGPILQVNGWLSQNIRNSTTYALNAYNLTQPGICTGDGLTFTAGGPLTLQNLIDRLPTTMGTTFSFGKMTRIHLFIRQIDRSGVPLPCGPNPSVANPINGIGFEIRVSAYYATATDVAVGPGPTAPSERSCQAYGRVAYRSDFPTPVFPPGASLEIRNGAGQVIPNEGCTCTAPPCIGMNTITATVTGLPSGYFPGCVRQGPGFIASPNLNPFCSSDSTSFTVNGTPVTAPNGHISFNANYNLSSTWNVTSNAPGNNDPSRITISLGGPDGRVSTTSLSSTFFVRAADCPANRPCGVDRLSGCGGGLCPPNPCAPPTFTGCAPTGSFCGPPAPPNPLTDSGGNPCPWNPCGYPGCPNPGLGCPDATTFCGVPVPATDACGNACDPGTNCPMPIVCTDETTFCGPPNGTPAQPLVNSIGQTCQDGTACVPPVCGFNCFPDPVSICGALEVACSPDPHACTAGTVFTGCADITGTGCGTCIMGNANCPCLL